MNESLFPCNLAKEKMVLAEEAVELAVKTWGKRSLTELEAEERLSYSCEKVNLFLDVDFDARKSLTDVCISRSAGIAATSLA